MKLSRNRPTPTSGRHRTVSQNVSPKQTSYSYSSRRSEEALNVGRGDVAKQKLAQGTRYSTSRIGLIILLIAVVVSLIKVLSLSTTADVKFIGSSGSNALADKNGLSTYQQAASSYLASSIWNSNKLTLDTSGLVRYLTNKYPELASVSVRVPFVDNHLVVYLSPTSPVIILAEPNAAYALDSSGRAILSAASVQSLNLGLPVVTDQSGLRVALGKMALTSDDVYFVEEVVGQLEAKNYKLASIDLPANSDELDVYPAKQAYFIKFNLNNNDPRQQVGTFLAVISNLRSTGQTPSKYVDVRVDGRAYYQ